MWTNASPPTMRPMRRQAGWPVRIRAGIPHTRRQPRDAQPRGNARRHRSKGCRTRRRTSRIAFSSIASNTGARLPGEALMTCNTSAVAVCCSSASRCLGDQPRVLHRDHRLGGEILQQRDLLVGEWPDLLAIDRDSSRAARRPCAAARSAACARRRDRPAARRPAIAGAIQLGRP